jgi:hypothetical protein
MLSAQKKYCPLQHETAWSVALHQQALLCKYWALEVKGARNKIGTRRQSIEIFQQLNEETQHKIMNITDYHHPAKTRLECHRQLCLATNYQKQLLRIHRELRHQGMLSLKEARLKEGNIEAAEIIRKIIRHEMHNDDLAIIRALKNPKGPKPLSKQELYIKQWQSINPVFHPPQQSGIKTIDIPHLDVNKQPANDPENTYTWKNISDPILIEEKLLARNIAHFGQAQGTLFTTSRLQQLFGYGGVAPSAEDHMKQPFDESKFPSMTQGATTLLNLISNNKG